MIKRTLLITIFTLIFIGCGKIPEKTDIEDLLETVIEEKCGNGTVDTGEECDFSEAMSCSKYDPELIGPYYCRKCLNNISQCVEKINCSAEMCSGKGSCHETWSHSIECKCEPTRRGADCSSCIIGYHFDLDGTCISDESCTIIGCEYANETCEVVSGQAECSCKEPWTGPECDKCTNNYYLENDECKPRYCHMEDIGCTMYEKCIDYRGKPECVCISKTQDPEDCSQCLPDYYLDIYSDDICINTKYANCRHDPSAAEGSEDIVKKEIVSYTDAEGWTEPGYCEWQCSENEYVYKNACEKLFLEKLIINVEYIIGVDKNGRVLAYSGIHQEEKIVDLSNHGEVVYEPEITMYHPKIGPDNNIYFIRSGKLGIFDTFSEKISFFEETQTINNDPLSILSGGEIAAGRYILNDFTVNNISDDEQEYTAAISDDKGNFLLVEAKGQLKAFDKHHNLLWEKEIENSTLSVYPVMNRKGDVYLPYKSSGSSYMIMSFNILTGELTTDQIEEAFDNEPKTIIDDNDSKYIVSKGTLYKFDNSNKLAFSKFIHDDYSCYPVLVDNSNIYLSDDDYVYNISINGDIVWKYYTEYGADSLFHHNGAIYAKNRNSTVIFNSPGKLKGDWPQYMQNSNFTGSIKEMTFSEPSDRTEIIFPENNSAISDNEVTFEWENSSDNAEYVLSFIDGDNYTEFFGPTSETNVTISDIEPDEHKVWSILTRHQDSEIYSVKESEFALRSEHIAWLYEPGGEIQPYNLVVSGNDILVPIEGVYNSKDIIIYNLETQKETRYTTDFGNDLLSTAADKNGNFYGIIGMYLFKINSEELLYRQHTDVSYFSDNSTYPVITEDNRVILYSRVDGNNTAFFSDFNEGPVIIDNSFYNFRVDSNIMNRRGIIFSSGINSVWGSVIKDDDLDEAILVYDDYVLFYNTSDKVYAVKDEFPEVSNEMIRMPWIKPIIVNNGELTAVSYLAGECKLFSGTPDNLEWRVIATWTCSLRPKKLVAASDGTVFAVEKNKIIVIKEGEETKIQHLTEENINDLALTSEGHLIAMTDHYIFGVRHDASGSDTGEWSQIRGNSRRSGTLDFHDSNLHADISLEFPADGSTVTDFQPDFQWNHNDPEDDQVSYDFYLYKKLESGYILIEKAEDLTQNSFKVTQQLESGTEYFWKVRAKDLTYGNNIKKASFFTSHIIPAKADDLIFTSDMGINLSNCAFNYNNELFVSGGGLGGLKSQNYFKIISSENHLSSSVCISENEGRDLFVTANEKFYKYDSFSGGILPEPLSNLGFLTEVMLCFNDGSVYISEENNNYAFDNHAMFNDEGEIIWASTYPGFTESDGYRSIGIETGNEKRILTAYKDRNRGTVYIHNENGELLLDEDLCDNYRCSVKEKSLAVTKDGSFVVSVNYNDLYSIVSIIDPDLNIRTFSTGLEYMQILAGEDYIYLFTKEGRITRVNIETLEKKTFEVNNIPLDANLFNSYLLENDKILQAFPTNYSTYISIVKIQNDSISQYLTTYLPTSIYNFEIDYNGHWWMRDSYGLSVYYGDDPVDMSQPWPMEGHDPGKSNTIQLDY